MALPKSVTKISKKGVTFTSNVNRAQYLIHELIRAALRDVARFLRRKMIDALKQLPGMRRSKRIYNSTQYWVRRRESDLVVGFKHDAWYGARQELGTHGMKGKNILRDTVYNNVDQIRIIQGKYLSAIEKENVAAGLIDESEVVPDEDG